VGTFTVTSAADTPDAVPGDGVCADAAAQCTLRAAITESNWMRGPNRIEFALVGVAPVRIQLSTSPMSLIQDRSGGLTIDGYTQAGSRVNTSTVGSNAIPGVEIRGNGTGLREVAFRITSPGNTVRGLLIHNVYRSVLLDQADASGNRIIGNWMGFT
jgi:CSLREA domain-containing protein